MADNTNGEISGVEDNTTFYCPECELSFNRRADGRNNLSKACPICGYTRTITQQAFHNAIDGRGA